MFSSNQSSSKLNRTSIPTTVSTLSSSSNPTYNATVMDSKISTSTPILTPTSLPTSLFVSNSTITTVPSSNSSVAPSSIPTINYLIPSTSTTLPSVVPAYERSSKTSNFPTIVHLYPILTFTINLEIGGISSCNLTLADRNAVLDTTSQSMSISTSCVSFFNCSFYNTPPSSPFAVIVLKTVVQLNAQDSGNTTNFYNALIRKLENEVSSGNATKIIHRIATSSNATAARNFTITKTTSKLIYVQYPLTINPSVQPTFSSSSLLSTTSPSSTSSISKRLSSGAIAGIVIGSLVMMMVPILAMIYYVSNGKSNVYKVAPVNYQTEEITMEP
jgi:hypothetical protein